MTDYTFDFTDITLSDAKSFILTLTFCNLLPDPTAGIWCIIYFAATHCDGLAMEDMMTLPPADLLEYITAFGQLWDAEMERRIAVLERDSDIAPVALDDVWTQW